MRPAMRLELRALLLVEQLVFGAVDVVRPGEHREMFVAVSED